MKNTKLLINTAQKKLIANPFDVAHDIHHHFNVWRNCYLIKAMEGLTPRMDVLEIAAWWHDYERGSDEQKTLRTEMQKLNFDEKYIEEIVRVINSHSNLDSEEIPIESNILFDADKIEYVSPGRFLLIGEGAIDGLLETKVAKMYGKYLMDRLDFILSSIKFQSTKQLFAINLKEYLLLMEDQKDRYKEFLEYIDKDILEEKLEELETELDG